jgi:hypothetical protein
MYTSSEPVPVIRQSVEAAQTAKRSPQFAASYQAIAKRRGKKIATTAVARKLITRAWHLLAGCASSA